MRSSGVMVMGYGAVLRGGQWGLDLVEFTDQSDLEEWLNDLPETDYHYIVCRAALRAIPLMSPKDLSNENSFEFFLTWRLSLYTAVAAATGTARLAAVRSRTKHFKNVASTNATDRNFMKASTLADLKFIPDTLFENAHNAAKFAASSMHMWGTRQSGAMAIEWASAPIGTTHFHNTLTADDFDSNDWTPLWPEELTPVGILDLWNDLSAQMKKEGESWIFWIEWYQAILKGQPLSWSMCYRIVMNLSDEDWNKGPEHVAEEIRKIRAAWEVEHGGLSEVSPEPVGAESTAALFERAPLVSASLTSMSATISLGVGAFDEISRPNEMVGMIEAMRALPETADRICNILKEGRGASGAETSLALEVGRLRAEVSRLENELKVAHKELDELRKKPWYKSASVVFTASALGTVVTGAWMLSGDDLELQDRWNKLAQDFEFLRSEMFSDPDTCFEEPLKFALPETVET